MVGVNMKTENLLLIAAIGAGAYLIFKNKDDKPANWDTLTGGVTTASGENFTGLPGLTTPNTVVVPPVLIPDSTGNNTPLKVDITSKSGSYTAAVPSYTGKASYDIISGIGYNAAGYGYSSATNLGAIGTGTGITTNVTTTTKTAPTDIFTKKPFS